MDATRQWNTRPLISLIPINHLKRGRLEAWTAMRRSPTSGSLLGILQGSKFPSQVTEVDRVRAWQQQMRFTALVLQRFAHRTQNVGKDMTVGLKLGCQIISEHFSHCHASCPLIFFKNNQEFVRILCRPLARFPLPLSGFPSGQRALWGPYVRIFGSKNPASKPKIVQYVRIIHPAFSPTFQGPEGLHPGASRGAARSQKGNSIQPRVELAMLALPQNENRALPAQFPSV